jgi:hypothetical protein
VRGDAEARGVGGRPPAVGLIKRLVTAALLLAPLLVGAQTVPSGATEVVASRFTIVAFPSEARLARSMLEAAVARDTFPGLPRPQAAVRILIAPDESTFREWVGPGAPEWGAAIAFPARHLIVMQGTNAGADAGDPLVTLRHELAHLVLHEALGPFVPRWFDEGYASYAAGEWGRDQLLATSFGLVWRGVPTLAALDSGFYAGAGRAERSYALAHRAVAELASISPDKGLTLLFSHWKSEESFERALRRAHGMTTTQFEERFRGRVRRQYGALALAADVTVLSVFLVVLLGPLWYRRRKRQRARLDALRAADLAQEQRERESALTALLGEVVPEPGDNDRIKGS